MLSLNQINAQIKLLEIWKSVKIENYPIKTNSVIRANDVALTRACSIGYLEERKLTNSSSRTFLNDAKHIWNKAPLAIKKCTTIYSAKKAIKSFVVSLSLYESHSIGNSYIGQN